MHLCLANEKTSNASGGGSVAATAAPGINHSVANINEYKPIWRLTSTNDHPINCSEP